MKKEKLVVKNVIESTRNFLIGEKGFWFNHHEHYYKWKLKPKKYIGIVLLGVAVLAN